jgi:hypothetical protein
VEWETEELTGPWICASDAFQVASERINRRGGPTEPVGTTLIRHAAAGFLPTASADIMHTVPIASVPEDFSKDAVAEPKWRPLDPSF